MISAQRIEWNNLDSLEFDLITGLSFDSDDGNSPSFLNQDGIYTEHYDGHRTIHRAKTNEFFNPTFTFIKKGFGDFTIDEQRKILSWLSIEKPGWLNVYHDDSNVLSYRCFGTWANIEVYKLGNSRVVGYVVSFASTHPYAWSRKFIYPEVHLTTEEINNNDETNDYLTINGTRSIDITCNTDEYNKLIYPKVVVNFNKDNIYIPVAERPNDNDFMFSNVIYTFKEANDKGVLEDKFFASIVTEDVKERAYVVTVPANSTLASLPTAFPGIKYFHVVDGRDHTIRIVEDDQWKTITKTGAAVKIDTVYTFGGETITKSIEVKNAALGEEITLDGTNKVVSVVWYDKDGTKINDVRVMGDDFNWEWLPLAYGDNNITITGNCDVQLQWIEPRKVGSL